MKKRVVSSVLTICMLLTLLPNAALAEEGLAGGEITPAVCTQEDNCPAESHEEGCPLYQEHAAPDESMERTDVADGTQFSEEEDPAESPSDTDTSTEQTPQEEPAPLDITPEETPSEYKMTLVVSKTGGAFSTIQDALDSITEAVDGAVLLQVDENITPGREAVLSIPSDKGITSFTIGTTNENGVTIDGSYQTYYLYANGVPLIIDEHVTIDSQAKIFGGGVEAVSGGTSITVNEGAAVGTIYGGGRDSDVGGDVSIHVSGTAGAIYGGGTAYAYTDTGVKHATANVGGQVQIRVSGDASTITGDIHGGGYAQSSSSKQAQQTLTANVGAGVEIYLDSPHLNGNTIYGGGHADIGNQAYGEGVSVYQGRHLTADVTGGVKITFTARAKSSKDEHHATLTLRGAGHANIQTTAYNIEVPDVSVSAQVSGGVTIDAAENQYAGAGVDAWDGSMFSHAYGGGIALGRYADATVTGDISFTTSRKAVESSNGGLAGGGYANQGGTARVVGNTQVIVCRPEGLDASLIHENAKNVIGGGQADNDGNATVTGNTKVVIQDNSAFESGGLGIIGGGFCHGSSGGVADVEGTATLEIGANVSVQGKIVGGGYSSNSSNTTGSANTGDVIVSIHGSQITNDIYGGGYNSNTGSVTMTICDNEFIGPTIYMAGDGVTVSGDSTLTLLGTSIINKVVQHDKADSSVTGRICINIGDGQKLTDVQIRNYFFCNQISSVSIQSNATLTGKDTVGNKLLWNVQDLFIAKDGKLVLAKIQSIDGDFRGEGTLVLPEGTAITIQGNYTGNVRLTTSGTETEGQLLAWTKQENTNGSFVYPSTEYSFIKILQTFDGINWYRWELSASKTVTAASVPSEEDGKTHGTVTPASQSVQTGGDAVFTITREPGYKVASITATTGGTVTDVTGELHQGALTLSNIQADTAVSVAFEKMTTEDVKQVTDQLPDLKDDEDLPKEVEQTILDTKMDYEALSEAEKAALPQEQKEKLHDALSKLSNVQVQVDVQVDGGQTDVFSVPEDQKPALLENMTKEEAAALKAGDTTVYKIVVTVAAADLNETVDSSIQGALKSATAAEHHDVTVKKIIESGTGSAEELLSALTKPIQLVFTIPESIRTPPSNMTRTFTMLRTHQNEDGSYTTQSLEGTVNQENWTYLVESGIFSVYTLAYTDTATGGSSGGHGSGGATTNPVTLPKEVEHGAVKASSSYAAKGSKVTVTVKPDAGYALDELTVTDNRGSQLKLTDQGGGRFTFTMPASQVVIQATFVPESGSEEGLPFLDVKQGDWFYDAVAYVYRAGMMTGTSGAAFSPNITTTRGMIVTILHRLEGTPAATAAGFDDVSAEEYYTKAVVWGAANGIVTGYGDGSFGPNDPITREQLAAILYRYARHKGYDVSAAGSLSSFSDAANVSGYAMEAMTWAVSAGLISGMGDGSITPQGNATRAQVAMTLMRFCEAFSK